MADMTGQVALVTGGTRGIGLAICERLIGRGIKVAARYAGRHDPAQQFADKYADCGVSIHGATSALTRTTCGLSARSWTGTGSRDLRALTRTRARLAQDQARHQGRVEKILEALLKTSVVISDLFGASGRRFLDALVAGKRSPKALAALGDKRLKATPWELEDALTGRFGDIHTTEIAVRLRLIDAIHAEITLLDEKLEQQLATVPGTAPACTACGLAGGGHAPGCAGEGTTLLILAERLDEITGFGECNARVLIAELGTDPATFPTPGHAAAWARLTSRSRQSGETAKPGRTGKGNRYLRGALGQSAMTAARTDTRVGALYRRIARKRGKQKAIVAVSRVICDIAWILICDPAARYEELGPDYYSPRSPAW